MTLTKHIANFHRIEFIFFNAISTKMKNFDEAVTAYFTGVRSPYLNPIFHTMECDDTPSVLETCARLYAQEKLPWVWVSKTDLLTPELETALAEVGAQLKYESTAIMCDLSDMGDYTPSQSLDIRYTQNLTDWIIPVYQAFESTKEIGAQYKKAHERTASMAICFYHIVGYVESKPVCALTLTSFQGMARIDDVATIPSHQGRGYGTEMLKYALSKAKDLGCETCFLEASGEGLSIYEKIGFRPLFRNKCYGKFAS